MSIQAVNGAVPTYPVSTAAKKTEQAEKEADQKTAEKNQDRFEKSTERVPVTYSKNQLTGTQLKQLQDDQRQRIDSFRAMLESMVVKQGQKSNLSLFGLRLNVSPADSQKAAAAIAEGGEYSVDSVATRILEMAKALAGGDESKISLLRGAVEKGFGAAGVQLGGKLPGICQDTYTEVMKRFDDWEDESRKAAAVSETE